MFFKWFLFLANVTILANDGSSGTVSFKSQDIVRIQESPGENTALNVARLEVIRGPGIYGVVSVPFKVIPEKLENLADLTPTQGVITFQDREVLFSILNIFKKLEKKKRVVWPETVWIRIYYRDLIFFVTRILFSWSWRLLMMIYRNMMRSLPSSC